MTTTTVTDSDILKKLGEPFAAGFMRSPDASMVERYATALREWAEVSDLTPYAGQSLYPCGPTLWRTRDMAASWYYVTATPLNREIYDRKYAAADDRGKEALAAFETVWTNHVFPGGYTHSIPHYDRVLAEGLNGFARRVEAGLDKALSEEDVKRTGFYRAMRTTLDIARVLHQRIVAEIERYEPADDAERKNRADLLAAYARIPFAPARTFVEALVATNFIFYLDGPDDLGRFDQYLGPFYDDSLARGEISRERAVELVRAQWTNVNDSVSWNTAIGGTDVDGRDLSNALTIVCIEAARGMRRPNLALRLGESTPGAVWEAALDTIATGCGLPALYWDPNYFSAMRASGIPLPEEEKHLYAFGGCTELMVHGRSFVGSLDDSINLPEALTRTIARKLATAESYDEFYRHYLDEVDAWIATIAENVNRWQKEKAEYQPQPIRSLLIDDCVDRGVEYSAGGARYNWSVINVMGLANAIDSLMAIRDVVFESGECTPATLVEILEKNFEGAEALRQRLTRSRRYGNGDEQADCLAHDLSQFVFTRFLARKTWRGGGPFVPSCLMFTTYAYFGEMVGATPDGRRAAEPIADSAGPYQGRDRSGPTAMLRSVASIDQIHAPGTLVVNIRLAKRHFTDPAGREKVRALIRGYFAMGGLQLQATVVDQKVLEDAVRHPEKHGDLIIRVGGYSEYWKNLDRTLRESILLRTEH